MTSEKKELMLEARRIEQAASLVTSIIHPGTKILVVDGLVANNADIQSATTGGGDVVLDDSGIHIKNNIEAAFSFEDVDGNFNTIYIVSGLSNQLSILNNNADGSINLKQRTSLDTNTSGRIELYEDSVAGRILLSLRDGDGAGGAKMNIQGNTYSSLILHNGLIELRVEDGARFLRMREGTDTPAEPSAGDAFHMYIKGDKLIIQFNDAGTMRYKYLDLTGTGVTWVHTTSAP